MTKTRTHLANSVQIAGVKELSRWLGIVYMLASCPLLAQRALGARSISAVAVAESIAVVAQTERHLISHPRDTAAWHRLGMVTWVLADRARAPEAPAGLDATRLGRAADSALRIAADLAPKDVGYRLLVGRYMLASNVAVTRLAARSHFLKALTVARSLGARALVAESALAYGRTFWWRYDVLQNRNLYTQPVAVPRSVSDAMQPLARSAAALEELANLQAAADLVGIPDWTKIPPDVLNKALAATAFQAAGAYAILPQTTFKDVRALLESSTSPLSTDVSGSADFQSASELFREAHSAAPSFPGAFRAVAMTYADRSMWVNLELLARQQIASAPRDSTAWMALGLAQHRLGKETSARVAFDSALKLLGTRERTRLTAWHRVLPLSVAPAFIPNDAGERALKERAYWLVASPFWADSTTQTEMEFLARVTYAELRWSVEEFGLSGADSDRGQVYIRYGPPERMIGIGPRGSDDTPEITTYWLYSSGLVFAFMGMPTFAMARFAPGDDALVSRIMQTQPARWDNIAAPAPDSLPVQVARFRAGRDSVDIFVASLFISPDSIRNTMSVAGSVRRFFWIVSPQLNRQPSAAGAVDTAGVYGWSQRLAPGSMVYRVEEFGETAARAGRATGVVDAGTNAFPLSGFGISDLLVGTGIASPSTGTMRWSDSHLLPSVGGVKRNGQVVVLWENYDMSRNGGNAEYDATLTLKRERTAAGRIAAQLAGALAAIAKRDATDGNRVSFTFSRSAPFAQAFADYVTLSLGDTPAGTYTVTIELKDRTSGAIATRTTRLTIKD